MIEGKNDHQSLSGGAYSGSFKNISTSKSRDYYNIAGSKSGTFYHGISFDAHNSSDIYKDDCTTVQPKSYTVLYIMKIKA